MLWLGLALPQQNYSWAFFGSVLYFGEKTTKIVKIRITVRECKLSCVNKD
jgi:hypothetical protein